MRDCLEHLFGSATITDPIIIIFIIIIIIIIIIIVANLFRVDEYKNLQ